MLLGDVVRNIALVAFRSTSSVHLIGGICRILVDFSVDISVDCFLVEIFSAEILLDFWVGVSVARSVRVSDVFVFPSFPPLILIPLILIPLILLSPMKVFWQRLIPVPPVFR